MSTRVFDDKKIKRIYINKHIIKANKKAATRKAPISVRTGGKTYKCWDVTIIGKSIVIYDPDYPQPCGAECWLETTSPVTIYQ